MKETLNEANTNAKKMVDDMKVRLKEALEEKKEFEIEYLSLQKNFVRLNKENKAMKESGASQDEVERLKNENQRLKAMA